MRTKTGLAAAALTLTALTGLGCAGIGDNRDGTGQAVTPTASATAAQSDTPLPMDGRTAQKYTDGLWLTVGAPRRYRPSAYAAGHRPGNTAITFTITFINNTGQRADLTLTNVQVALGQQGVPASQVFAEDLADMPSAGHLAHNRRKTVKLGFSADTTDTTAVDVTVTPGFLNYTPALFTGAVR